ENSEINYQVNQSSFGFSGFIQIGIDNATGIAAEWAPQGACAMPIGAIGVVNTLEKNNISQTRSCPKVDTPRPQPEQCLFRLDANGAKEINETVRNQIGLCDRVLEVKKRYPFLQTPYCSAAAWSFTHIDIRAVFIIALISVLTLL